MSTCSLDLAVERPSAGTLYEIHTDIYFNSSRRMSFVLVTFTPSSTKIVDLSHHSLLWVDTM